RHTMSDRDWSSDVCSSDLTGKADVALFRREQVLIGFLRPLGSLEIIQEIAGKGVTSFSVELMPRTTRAQSMDALSSMGTICGYRSEERRVGKEWWIRCGGK